MNYRTERWPVVTLSLIAINTLVWLISLICNITTDGAADEWIMTHLWLAPATSPWYAWLTSMFVHAGFMHLLGNMLYLFLFGCCAEDLIGRGWFLLYYLLGGFISELAFIAVSPLHFASDIPSGGASGAISTCLGMYLLLRPAAEIEFKYFFFFWFMVFTFRSGEFEVPAWMAIGFWFLEDVAHMIWNIYFPSHGGGVAFGAHVGGLLAGLAFIGLSKLAAKKNAGSNPSTCLLSPEEIQAAAGLNQAPTSLEIPTIFLSENAVQSGPFTLTQIQGRLARHELDAETLYWSEGMTEWGNVKDLA